MLTLRDAFELLQEECTLEICEAVFPRLRKLARNGRVPEEIFQVVTHVATQRLSNFKPMKRGNQNQRAGRLGGHRSAELAATGARMSMADRARVRWAA